MAAIHPGTIEAHGQVDDFLVGVTGCSTGGGGQIHVHASNDLRGISEDVVGHHHAGFDDSSTVENKGGLVHSVHVQELTQLHYAAVAHTHV